MNETEKYDVLKKVGVAYISPNHHTTFRNGPVYKCALPQTHLPFKLSEIDQFWENSHLNNIEYFNQKIWYSSLFI